MKSVSIIILAYNKKELIAKAIDNILSQIYNKFEIIYLDDGSTGLQKTGIFGLKR